jgi:hypothetical protein
MRKTYSDGAKLELFLKVLEWNRTCNIHQSSRQFTWVAEWKESIMAVLPLPTPLSDRAPTSNAPNSPQIPPRAQAGPLVATTLSMTVKRDALTVQIVPSPRTPPGPTFGPGAYLALYWPKAYDLSPFNILPHADRYASPTNSHELIRAEIRKPLIRACDKHLWKCSFSASVMASAFPSSFAHSSDMIVDGQG